ncbi:hypothetical protein J3Q64DRAFT_1704737 [Phycomyces blakesleeanus]|uniref:Uncharacterized protein n=1 Tax=Phycomyces blakesleeanus TaxID=4837 RepID=A0ABR3AJ76_PHYBL
MTLGILVNKLLYIYSDSSDIWYIYFNKSKERDKEYKIVKSMIVRSSPVQSGFFFEKYFIRFASIYVKRILQLIVIESLGPIQSVASIQSQVPMQCSFSFDLI